MPIVRPQLLKVVVIVAACLQTLVLLTAITVAVYSFISPVDDPLDWFGLMTGLLLFTIGGLAATEAPIRLNGGIAGLSLLASMLLINADGHPAVAGAGMAIVSLMAMLLSVAAWRHLQAATSVAAPAADLS